MSDDGKVYQKINGKFVELVDVSRALGRRPPGAYVTVIDDCSSHYSNRITPAYAPFVAVTMRLKDDLATEVLESMDTFFEYDSMTSEQQDAWNNFVKQMGNKVYFKSPFGIASTIIDILEKHVAADLEHPALKNAHISYLTLADLIHNPVK